jgi:hypothetical protein
VRPNGNDVQTKYTEPQVYDVGDRFVICLPMFVFKAKRLNWAWQSSGSYPRATERSV